MNEKKCPRCQELKSLDNFSKCKSRKDGLKVYCKLCSSIEKKKYYQETIDNQKEYRDKNKDKSKDYNKNYYQKNKEEIKEKSKNYYKENKEEIKEHTKKYNEINKDKIKERKKRYRKNNKEKRKKYYENNKNKRIEYQKKYKTINPDRCKKWQSTYRENNKDKIYKSKLRYNEKNPHIVAWRNLLKNTLNRFNKTKNNKTVELLGYSATDLKTHISNLFTIGMSWENYGEWHIDHIRPLSSFEPDTPASIVCALDNLQPLWATTREIDGIIYEGNLNKNCRF
jgi:hypothetical protein